ncbi:MAG: hypothetical protein KKF01_06375 [Proteobacteria bacterium]|nr:hypothetical protein [Pseudomonadota bacterium]
MNIKPKRTVVKLGRVCRLLENLEALPEYQGCATSIRKARMITQQTMNELSKSRSSVISEKLVKIVKFLAEVLVLLERLKNLFNFCLQPFLYGYKYICQVRQALKDDKSCFWNEAKNIVKCAEYSSISVIDVRKWEKRVTTYFY